MAAGNHEAFVDALRGLHGGDFSRLEPLFDAAPGSPETPPRIIEWYEEGRFRDEPKALAEALTCACFLGRTSVATHLLTHGVNPSGGAGTGLDAVHWAANRGELAAVRLLIQWKAPLETRNMHGDTVLGTAVWSALNEPRSDHLRIIEELLQAGARLEDVEPPTAYVKGRLKRFLLKRRLEHIDAALRVAARSSKPRQPASGVDTSG